MPPTRLVTFQTQLRRFNLDSQRPEKFNVELWERHLGDSDALEDIAGRFHNGISRQGLKKLAADSLDTPNGRRTLFIAIMIWGYAGQNYGPSRTRVMLNDERLNEVLGHTVKGLRAGNLAEAFAGFRIRGCGSSFFTKFFYFSGLASNLAPLPLILDSRVKKTLDILSHEEQTNYAPLCHKSPQGYCTYVKQLTQWAEELGCRSDAIELVLYDPSYVFWL